MSLAMILSALILSAAPTAAPQEPAAAPAAGEALVCKYTIKTGTRFRDKKCRTRAEWDAITEAARQNMKDIVDRPQIRVPGDPSAEGQCQGSVQC